VTVEPEATTSRPSIADRVELGKAARKRVSRSSHADWAPAPDRPDPVELLAEQNADRIPFLVPVRHGRMMVSPFTFYRGAARVMAADLATTPDSGLRVQVCGDAHLANFGTYASPERQLVFDMNDFDETLPGPWEWDVKRLAASFTIAGRHRGLDDDRCSHLAEVAAGQYRQAMARFADMRTMDLWYDRLSGDDLRRLDSFSEKANRKALARFEAKARSKDSLQALRKLAVDVDGEYQIRNDPPVLLPLRTLGPDVLPPDVDQVVRDAFLSYKASLPDDRRRLLDHFRPVDVAMKVVGVGSVGTRCLILLLEGRDREDPLFLQIKEATPSVLEEHLPPSGYDNHGRRVVEGQRLMQAVSDICLGWTHGAGGRDYYVRQLRDWKGSVDLEGVAVDFFDHYARLCGWTLARAHARTGDAVAIASYLGTSSAFDKAIGVFSQAYAHQNEADHRAFVAAIDAGRLEATPGQ
jgi:uncharacterized protein (DUF2252 family)